jgi:hypothetical protein
MFVQLDRVNHDLVGVVEGLDPRALTPQEAAKALERFAAIERRAAAGRLLVAARAAESEVWKRAGFRSTAHWLAHELGVTIGKASRILGVSDDLADLTDTADALRGGELSEQQASEVASAASAAPSAEADLLDEAAKGDVHTLKKKARQTRLAAAGDEAARRERLRRARALRWFNDDEGATNLLARGLPEVMAEVKARLSPFVEEQFHRARREGRREKLETYAFDALVEALRAASEATSTPDANHEASVADDAPSDGGATDTDSSSPSRPPKRRPPSEVVVLIDLEALRRGHAQPGETCDIPGVGPVSVAAAREYLGDGLLSLVVTDGIDIQTVVRPGRARTVGQWLALLVRDRTCSVPHCGARDFLEDHHVAAYRQTKHTTVSELAKLCRHHHALVTRHGYDLRGSPGAWEWCPPDEHDPPLARAG